MKKYLTLLASSVCALLFATSAFAEVTNAELTPTWSWDGSGAASASRVTLGNGETVTGFTVSGKVFKTADLGITIPAKNFTYSFWVKAHTSNWKNYGGFADASNVVQFQKNSSADGIAFYKNSGDWQAGMNTGLSTSEYKLLTFVQNAGTLTIYVNGSALSTTVDMSAWSNLLSDDATMPYFALGTAPQTNGNAYGDRNVVVSVADCRLYNKALTAEQVTALHSGGVFAGFVGRSIDSNSDWSSTMSWKEGATQRDAPGMDAPVRLDAVADATLTMNAAADLTMFEVMPNATTVRVAVQEDGSLTTDATHVYGNLTVTNAYAKLGAVTIAAGKTLTVDETTTFTIADEANKGTLHIIGGTKENPITVETGNEALSFIGNITLADNSAIHLQATGSGNKGYHLTGEGPLSHVYLTSDHNWGADKDESYFSNLTLEVPATVPGTSDNNASFWLTGGKTSSTVHFITAMQVTMENSVMSVFYDFASLAGSGTMKGDGRSIKIHDGADANYSGCFSGGGSFTKAGTGTQILSGKNTYTGDTKVEGGTLKLASTGAINKSSDILIQSGATFEIEVAAEATTTPENLFRGIEVDDEMTYGTIRKTGDGTLILTETVLEHFAGGKIDVVAGGIKLPLDFAKTATFGNGVTALTVVLNDLQILETIDFSSLVTAGATVSFVDVNDNSIASDGGIYTPPLKTWTIESDGDIDWSTTDWKQGEQAVNAPVSTEMACINIGSHTVTLKIPAEGVTVADLKIEGGGAIQIEGGILTVTKLLDAESDVSYKWGEVATAEYNIAQGKTLTITTTGTDVENPDTYKTDNTFDLPALMGDGILVLQGTGALVLRDKHAEPLIQVSSGTLHLVDAVDSSFDNSFHLEIDDGAILRFSTWAGNYGNNETENTILLKGGSEMIVSNGSYGENYIYAAITIDATDENPAKIYGAAFNTVTMHGGITGFGLLEFAEGKAYGTTGNYCDRTLVVAGTIADADEAVLKVKVSDLKNQIQFSGANTYSGDTEIVAGATLKVDHASALGNGAVIGEGTVQFTSQAHLATNETAPNLLNNKFTEVGTSATDGWRGSVELKDVSQSGARNNVLLEKLGNANSTVIINGMTGWFKSGTYEIGKIVIGENGLTVNNALDVTAKFTGVLEGAGSITLTNGSSWAPDYALQFVGDVSNYSGSITVNSNPTDFGFIFGNGARESGKIIIAADATVNVGGTWSPQNGVSVAGTIGGTGTIAGNLAFASGATLDVNGDTPLQVTGEGSTVTFGETLNVKLTAEPTGDVMVLSTTALTDAPASTITIDGTVNPDYKLAVKEGALYVVAKVYVAQVTHDGVTTGYETFDAAAWNTVVAGDTVTILGAVTWPETIPEGVTITRGADADVAVPDGYEWDADGTLQHVTTAEVATAADLATALAKDNLVTITVTEDIEISGELTLATGKTLIIPAGVTVTAKAGPLVVAGTIEVSGVLNGYELPYGAEGLVPSQGGTVVIGDTGTVVMPKVWENAGLNPNTENLYVIGDCEAGATIIIGDNEVWICAGNDAWTQQVAKVGTDGYYPTLAAALAAEGEVTLLAEGLTLETYNDTDAINLNGKTLTLGGNGGELAGNLKGGGKLIVGAPVTLTKANTELTADIEINQVLTVTDKQALNNTANGGTITGAGTLVIGGEYKGSSADDPLWNKNGLSKDGWTGTVSFRTIAHQAMLSVAALCCNAQSTIEFDGATGRMDTTEFAPLTIPAKVVRLAGTGLQIRTSANKTSIQRVNIPKLEGKGVLKGPANDGWKYAFIITDASNFDGSINLPIDSHAYAMSVVIGGDENMTYDSSLHDSYAGKILILSGATATIAGDQTWTPRATTGKVLVEGTIGGMGTIAGILKFQGALATLDASAGVLTVNDVVEYDSTSTFALTVKLANAPTADEPVLVLQNAADALAAPAAGQYTLTVGDKTLENCELVVDTIDDVKGLYAKLIPAPEPEKPTTVPNDGQGVELTGVDSLEAAQAVADKMAPTLSEEDVAKGLQAEYLKVVAEEDGDSFKAVVVLDDTKVGKPSVEAEGETPAIDIIDSTDSTEDGSDQVITINVKKTVKGVWYGFESATSLEAGLTIDAGTFRRAGDTGVRLSTEKSEKAFKGKGFFRVKALPYKPAVK